MHEPERTFITVKQVFIKALARIEDPKHWTRGTYARDAQGHTVHASHASAVKWCLRGAMMVVPPLGTGQSMFLLYHNAAEALLRTSPFRNRYDSLTVANDTPIKDGGLGHKGVVAALREAIEACDE